MCLSVIRERGSGKQRAAAFTLAEVVICIALVALLMTGIIFGHVQAAYRAEWTGYSLAAQALAIQQLEQARSAKWDILDTPAVDELASSAFPLVTVANLDLPIAGTNVVQATNFTTVSLIPIANNPVVNVHLVKVDTVWPFRWKGTTRLYTNTIANYYAPDR